VAARIGRTANYVAYLRVNTEGDYYGTYYADTFKTPQVELTGPRGRELRAIVTAASVVDRVCSLVPFTLRGRPRLFSTMTPVGFGSRRRDGTPIPASCTG
jgi:hypothetical protein